MRVVLNSLGPNELRLEHGKWGEGELVLWQTERFAVASEICWKLLELRLVTEHSRLKMALDPETFHGEMRFCYVCAWCDSFNWSL